MIEKVEGIVINERSYSETSKILDVYTKKYGIIGVLSKGCKKMKSELRSVSTRLTYGYFHINYKENKLSNLIGVDVLHLFKNIQSDIVKVSYSSLLLELAANVERQHSNKEIYNLLIDALNKIEEGFDPIIISNILELKYLYYLGVMPNLSSCVLCGDSKSIVTISSSKGGYICKNCLSNDKFVSIKTIKLIRMFYYVDISKISKLELGIREKKEIHEFLNDYYDRYTGLYLKSKNFINNLNKIA